MIFKNLSNFTEKINKNNLNKLGKIKEKTLKRVVLEVPKGESKRVAVELLNNYPVDDILINEVDIEEVIRKVFGR